MPRSSIDNVLLGRRYALCVGIGTYTELTNRNLRYAVADANTIAERLADPQRGNFDVTLLTEPAQTSKTALEDALDELLNAPDRKAEDLVVIYFSCHGGIVHQDNTFCLLPSNATLQNDATFKKTTVLGIYDLTKLLSGARARNIIVLLDVCHSGGAGVALQHLSLDLPSGPNLFIIGAARQDQAAMQSSQLEHGIFTHCLLRAFGQPPTKDGWLTISQILSFISDEIPWYAKDHPIQIQEWSISVNPNLPLLRNPGYPKHCPLPPIWTVPFQPNPFFTGQEDVLARLASMLQSEQKTVLTQPQAISGLGGIGKTQLALEYAYRHRQDYHAILWSRADTREALISTFINIASLLDLPQKDEKDQMVIVQAVKRWLMEHSQWLLILDNADDLAMVKEFIPPAFRGHLLLTTRAQMMGGLAHKIEAEVMRPETGALLLLRRAGLIAPDDPLRKAAPADVTVAKELSEEMGGLPLALDQAGAYIEETHCDLSQYLQRYRRRRALLLKRRGGMVLDHPEPVTTTWSLSFEKVEQANPVAAELLRLCAFLAPDAIPEEIITQGAAHLGPVLAPVAEDPITLDEAIAALGAYSLVQRNPADKTLSIHRLVQAVLKDTMDEKACQQWAARAVHALYAALPSTNHEDWPRWERIVPHVQNCAQYINEWDFQFEEAITLLHQTGRYLYDHAQYEEAEELLTSGLKLRERSLGSDHLDVAHFRHDLANVYSKLGKYREAKEEYKRSLKIRKQSLGPNDPDVADSLCGLANVYSELGKYREAEEEYKRSLEIRKQSLGHYDLKVASLLNNLAIIYKVRGENKKAKSSYLDCLCIFERKLAVYDLNFTQPLRDLLVPYDQADRLIQALDSLSTQALGKHKREFLGFAQVLNNLAVLYAEQYDEYKTAALLLERSLEIRKKFLGENHPDIAQCLNNLANVYTAQVKYKKEELYQSDPYTEAEKLYRRSLKLLGIFGQLKSGELLEISDKLSINELLDILYRWEGFERHEVAYALNGLAILYFERGKDEEATKLYEQSQSIWERYLKKTDHPQRAYPLNNLAVLYYKQGNVAKAERLCQEALEIFEGKLKEEHRHTKTCAKNHAILLHILKRDAELRNLVRRYKFFHERLDELEVLPTYRSLRL